MMQAEWIVNLQGYPKRMIFLPNKLAAYDTIFRAEFQIQPTYCKIERVILKEGVRLR